MATITQYVSSQFYNVKIGKPIANLAGNDAITAEYVTNQLAGLTIPTEAVDTTLFLKKALPNTMTGTGNIIFSNGTSTLLLDNTGITSALPTKLNAELSISNGASLNMKHTSNLKFIGSTEAILLNISDSGVTSKVPVELTSTSMNLKSSTIDLTNVNASTTDPNVKLNNTSINLTNGAQLTYKIGDSSSANSLAINNTDGITSSLKVNFTNDSNVIDKLQTKYLSIGDDWRIEEDPTTKNLLFKFKNPTTQLYELGVPFFAPPTIAGI